MDAEQQGPYPFDMITGQRLCPVDTVVSILKEVWNARILLLSGLNFTHIEKEAVSFSGLDNKQQVSFSGFKTGEQHPPLQLMN